MRHILVPLSPSLQDQLPPSEAQSWSHNMYLKRFFFIIIPELQGNVVSLPSVQQWYFPSDKTCSTSLLLTHGCHLNEVFVLLHAGGGFVSAVIMTQNGWLQKREGREKQRERAREAISLLRVWTRHKHVWPPAVSLNEQSGFFITTLRCFLKVVDWFDILRVVQTLGCEQKTAVNRALTLLVTEVNHHFTSVLTGSGHHGQHLSNPDYLSINTEV